MGRTFSVLWAIFLVCGGALGGVARGELKPDELLLVVNRNIPESRQLAEYYAEQRQIPPGRIVEVPLPVGEQITLDMYEENMAAVVRSFLIENQLNNKVRCLVTFYGVPIRIQQRRQMADEQQEYKALQTKQAQASEGALVALNEFENLVASANSSFKPGEGSPLDRYRRAFEDVLKNRATVPAEHRDDFDGRVIELLERLDGYGAVLKYSRAAGRPDDSERLHATEQAFAQLPGLVQKPWNRDAREQLREIVEKNSGLIGLLSVLDNQLDYLSSAEGTVAAVDSELAALWWQHRVVGMLANPLHYSVSGPVPPTLMVARLDAAQPEHVYQMMVGSLKAEKEGLQGPVVLDSRGIYPTNAQAGGKPDANAGYAAYDERIRVLARLLKEKTTLKLIVDDGPEVLRADAVPEMALYCGWYSLRKYVPAFQFIRPGAVGYHVASFEMVSLRMPGEQGWVANLLRDGIGGTLGAVAEPYLGAFPNPDDFFPLLLTGKFTLAEVYWKTTPTLSWRMALVGDPLYRPYMVNPALKLEDLPERLRAVAP